MVRKIIQEEIRKAGGNQGPVEDMFIPLEKYNRDALRKYPITVQETEGPLRRLSSAIVRGGERIRRWILDR